MKIEIEGSQLQWKVSFSGNEYCLREQDSKWVLFRSDGFLLPNWSLPIACSIPEALGMALQYLLE